MPTILVIDDNILDNEHLIEMLKFANYKVIVADNGKQGLLMAEAWIPDLILCDLSLPILDGFVVLQMLSRSEACCRIPFIFLTARATREDIRMGMELGANDYITKPFNPSELLSSIECQLRKVTGPGLSEIKEVKPQNQETGRPGNVGHPSMQALVADRKLRAVKNRRAIYQEGNYPSLLYYILKGKVKTYIIDKDGKELITEIYGEGEFFGYTPLLHQKRYIDTAAAIGDVELSVIPYSDFERKLFEDNNFRKQIIRLLARDIKGREKQLLKSAYDSLRKKTAEALLVVYNKYNQSAQGNTGIRFTRSNLAALAGVAKESLARILAEFRDEHLIDVRNGTIFILDMDKITRMCS